MDLEKCIGNKYRISTNTKKTSSNQSENGRSQSHKQNTSNAFKYTTNEYENEIKEINRNYLCQYSVGYYSLDDSTFCSHSVHTAHSVTKMCVRIIKSMAICYSNRKTVQH